MKLTKRGRLVEEVKRRRRHDRVQRAIVEWQMLGRPLAPLHLRRARPGLGEHAVGHVDTVDLVGAQLFGNAVSENACAAGNIGHSARAAVRQRSDYFILRWPVHPLLKKWEIVQRRGDGPELCDRAIQSSARRRRHQFQTDMSSGGYCMQMSVVCAATPLLLKNSFAQLGQFHASCS